MLPYVAHPAAPVLRAGRDDLLQVIRAKQSQKLLWSARKFRQGGMVRDLSPSPTLLGPLGGKTRSSSGTREAVQGSPSCLAQKPLCWENK